MTAPAAPFAAAAVELATHFEKCAAKVAAMFTADYTIGGYVSNPAALVSFLPNPTATTERQTQ